MTKARTYWYALSFVAAMPCTTLGQVFLHWLGPPSNQNVVTRLSLAGDAAVMNGQRWTLENGSHPLPPAPEMGATQPVAQRISGDGQVIVGTYSTPTAQVLFHLRNGVYRDVGRSSVQPVWVPLPTVRGVNVDGTSVLIHREGHSKAAQYVGIWGETGPFQTVRSWDFSAEVSAVVANPDFSIIAISATGGCFALLNRMTYVNNFAPAIPPTPNWTVRVSFMSPNGGVLVGTTGWPVGITHRWDNQVPSPFPSLVGTPLAIADDASAIITSQYVWTAASPTVSHRTYLEARGGRFAPGDVAITHAAGTLQAFAGVGPSPTGPGQQRFVIRFPTSGCDSIDFNNDGLLPDVHDVQEFLSVFSGQGCSSTTCNDIDFNNDGSFPDIADIDAFVRTFSGGPC